MSTSSNASTGSSLPLKEVLRIMKETATDMACVVRQALEAWLAVVQQLPEHPPNPYTASAVQVAHAAYQKGHAGMTGEDGLAWLKQHVRAVCGAVGSHFSKQLQITAKRIQVVTKLSERVQQQAGGGGQAGSNQIAAQILVEEQACVLLGCALQAYRTIGPASAVISTLEELEDVAAAENQHKHRTRRELLSGEIYLVNTILSRMGEQMIRYPALTTHYLEVYAQLGSGPSKRLTNDIETSAVLRGQGVAAAAAVQVWVPAAVRFPANNEHRASTAMLGMVDWSALLRHSRSNKQLGQSAALVVLSLLARQDLRDMLLDHHGPGLLQVLLIMCEISTEQVQALQVPKAARQQLLRWLEDAQRNAVSFKLTGKLATDDEETEGDHSDSDEQTEDDHSISDAQAEVHMHVGQQGAASKEGGSGDTSSSSSPEHTAPGTGADVGDGTDHPQQLLEMMHGLSGLGKE